MLSWLCFSATTLNICHLEINNAEHIAHLGQTLIRRFGYNNDINLDHLNIQTFSIKLTVYVILPFRCLTNISLVAQELTFLINWSIPGKNSHSLHQCGLAPSWWRHIYATFWQNSSQPGVPCKDKISV